MEERDDELERCEGVEDMRLGDHGRDNGGFWIMTSGGIIRFGFNEEREYEEEVSKIKSIIKQGERSRAGNQP